MSTMEQIISKLRSDIYGREMREDIVDLATTVDTIAQDAVTTAQNATTTANSFSSRISTLESDNTANKSDITKLQGDLENLSLEEVEDIRKGYDGTVYETAGDAVRGQIEQSLIRNKMYEIPIDYTQEGSLISVGGTLVANEYYCRTDYIDVSSTKKMKIERGNYINKYICFIAFYDSDKKYISGVSGAQENDEALADLTVPDGAKYFIVSSDKGSVGKIRVYAGIESAILNISQNLNEIDSLKTDIETLLDKNDYLYNNLLDVIDTTPYGDSISEDLLYVTSTFSGWRSTYSATGSILLLKSIEFKIKARADPITTVAAYIYEDDVLKYKDTKTVSIKSNETQLVKFEFEAVKLDASESYGFGYQCDAYTDMCRVKGAEITPSVTYYRTDGRMDGKWEESIEPMAFYLKMGVLSKAEGEAEKKELVLSLPERFPLIVGDKFELFWKGALLASDPYQYNIKATCNMGNNFKRNYYAYPQSADIGQHTLNVKVYDDFNNELANKDVNLVVKALPSSPQSEKVILCVGDSLTQWGQWPSEMKRRITSSDSATETSPAGNGLSNLTWIGNRNVTTPVSCDYVGEGGWTIDSYLSAMSTNKFQLITTTHDKTQSDQHSVYSDSSGAQWKLETIETGRIKLIYYDGSAAHDLSSGTLTWVSGGENHSDISFTSAEIAPGNPFWNNGQVDIANFVTSKGKNSLDYMYILLGWNSTGNTMEYLKEKFTTFINYVHEDYPNCQVVLMGLQVPSLDGFGQNYGCSWNFIEKAKFVFNYNAMLEELANEIANVNFVNIAAQFDTEYGMPTINAHVNSRTSTTVPRQSNGVHPATNGYYQIADAVYRDLMSRL